MRWPRAPSRRGFAPSGGAGCRDHCCGGGRDRHREPVRHLAADRAGGAAAGRSNYRLGDLSTQIAIAAAVDGVRELSLLDRWTYAMCPADERDEGVERLADWAVEHALGRAVAPPRAGHLPPPARASQEALQLAERVHRRLVAWRWMALRFPEVYRDIDGALAESRRLNEWIEAVLATRPSGRVLVVPGGVVGEAGGALQGHSRRRQFGQRARAAQQP
ncbi:SUV3 C-terminal domain-containing protein [Siccirubricoccus deserti]